MFKNKNTYSRTPQTGFTIVELLIVIVVIAVLAGISVVVFQGVRARAQDSAKASDVASVLKVMANIHAVNGEYDTEILMAEGRYMGGVLDAIDIARLQRNGLQPDVMKSPTAPDRITSSFMFNNYDDDQNTKPTGSLDMDTITVEVPGTLPNGFSSWDEAYDAFYTDIDDFSATYSQSHPDPGGNASGQEWDQWYEAYESALFAQYPQYEQIYRYGDWGSVSVPKASIYFVDLLGANLGSSSGCTYSSGSAFSCYSYGDDYGAREVTGVAIYFFNESTKTWKEQRIGSGDKFTYYSENVPT